MHIVQYYAFLSSMALSTNNVVIPRTAGCERKKKVLSLLERFS